MDHFRGVTPSPSTIDDDDRNCERAPLPTPLAASIAATPASTTPPPTAHRDVSSANENLSASPNNGLDAYRNSREIIRLVQCTTCSFPIRYPIALPCGNTICRDCLPQPYLRQNISFPNTPDRQGGFLCSFVDCRKEHPLADCAIDVVLAKVLNVFDQILGTAPSSLKHELGNEHGVGMDRQDKRAGRLLSTYSLAKTGRLGYDGDMTYTEETSTVGIDAEVLRNVVTTAAMEMECQVCYGLLLDPVTTHCGHTFCRRCLQRVLDHSQRCPLCRQALQLLSVFPATSTNKLLNAILVGLLPGALAKRAATVTIEEMSGSDVDEGLTTPLFVCTCSFPAMPTPLFVFEPRFRLMVRRVMEGNRQFGMVLPNKGREAQGSLGDVPFMQYGTMLYIQDIYIYPDGRSHIWTVGVTKFMVKDWGLRDDYVVAKVERMDDVPIAEEEAVEALETSHLSQLSDPSSPWTRLPTLSLLQTCHGFLDHMQAISAPWMSPNNLTTFCLRPDDPAIFPYWLASVLPIADLEKYRLIKSRSVRERLLIAVSWVKRIENHRW
jgi:Lon protease-like protein